MRLTRSWEPLWPACWSLLGMALLAGCDPQRVAKLEEGVSTEVDVRKQFGDPVTVTVAPDGTRILDYPRQPEGWTNYVIKIGPDGKMSSLRQLLNEDNFARIQPGLDAQEVRDTLGRPAETEALRPQEGRGVELALQAGEREPALHRHLRGGRPRARHGQGGRPARAGPGRQVSGDAPRCPDRAMRRALPDERTASRPFAREAGDRSRLSASRARPASGMSHAARGTRSTRRTTCEGVTSWRAHRVSKAFFLSGPPERSGGQS